MAIFKPWIARAKSAFALVVCVVAMACQPAQAGDPGQALILFDNSGSMWGKIGGTADPKYLVAATALNEALSAVSGSTRVPGLVLFGGRCTSAPLAVAPGEDASGQISGILAGLNPKGKGPLSLALETAANGLPKDNNASVILIHDGPDNCRGDPCAAAEAFASSHPGVPVHLVSIGLPKAARIATACVAKLTGGTVAQVESMAQLNDAVLAAVKLAMPGPAQKPADPSTSDALSEAGEEEDAPVKTGPPRLRLSAKLGSSGKTLKTPVRWRVFRSGSEGETPLIDIVEPRLTMPLPAGAYTVIASVGLLEQRDVVDVESQGISDLKVAFDAGRVLMRAPAMVHASPSNGPLSGESTIVTLSGGGQKGLQGFSAPIVVADGGLSDVIMPAGTYRLVMQKGRARNEQTISIVAGKTMDVDLDLGTGELELELSTSNGSVLKDGVLYKISVDDPEARSGRREIIRSTAKKPSFTLAAGTYYVSAKVGFAEAKTRVAVEAGKSSLGKLELAAALLEVQTDLSISGQPSQLPVQYRIIHVGTEERVTALTAKRSPTFVLAPGKYRIVAEIGARNVTATADVDLPAGSKTRVKLNPRAGSVGLKLGGQSSAATVNRFWVVRDQTGNVVWRSSAFAPSALLAPGVYEVTCETRNGEVKKAFELAAGENKSVELSYR